MVVLLGAVVLALSFTALAAAYAATYVQNVTWGAGSKDQSAYVSSLNGTAISFNNPNGGLPQMGARYVDYYNVGVTSYVWSNTGSLLDDRDYAGSARSECKANSGNGYVVFVYSCYTNN
jgi:hypothetical protein